MYREEDYQPSPRTAKRAAFLFTELCRKPKFDNGDLSLTGMMCQTLAERLPHEPDGQKLIAFRDGLEQFLLEEDDKGYRHASLDVDYGPSLYIANIADRIGLKVQFPWKTNVWAYRDHVTVRAGYTAETIYHYALDGGKWLVTSLSGSEVEKIKKFVLTGEVPSFTVESESAA